MRVLVFPEDRTNPYQRLLYDEVARAGAQWRYVPMRTASQTLNLLLLPMWLAVMRVRGYRVLHLHWVYLFAPSWVRHVRGGRELMQAWFFACIAIARLLGYRLVWTAHNILPGAQVFPDDEAARRRLIAQVHAVVVHSAVTRPALEALGADEVRVIQAGSYVGNYEQALTRDEARERLGMSGGGRVVAFVGIIEEYKGVDVLLEAIERAPELALRVVIAGWCRSPVLLERLRSLAGRLGDRALVRFEYVPDDELQVYLGAADVAAFPFRRITNSSSMLLACSFGVPPLVPDMPELADFPDEAVLRYDPAPGGINRALARVASASHAELAERSAAARRYADSLTWDKTAAATVALYGELLASR